MDAAPRPGRVAEAALLAAVGLVLGWAVLFGGGSGDGSLAGAGIAAIAFAAAGLVAALRGALPLPRLDRAGTVTAVAAAALTLWVGLSISWSIAGDLAWDWLARGLVYLAFLALGLLAGALVGGVRRVAALAAIVLAAAIGWALLGVAVPSLFPDGDRIARLREPVGYWNALALLADAGLALGLWVARSPRGAARVAGCLLGYGAALAVLLTQSRAGVVGAAAVLVLWLALSDERSEAASRAGIACLPALLVAGWAFTRPALVEDGALRSDRVADGKAFAALTVAGGLAVALAAWRLPVRRLLADRGGVVRGVLVGSAPWPSWPERSAWSPRSGIPTRGPTPRSQAASASTSRGGSTDLCANNRLQWWGEALDVTADRPVGGSGAGTFALARRRYRENATPVTEPHSVPLQLLADLGVVGLALGLAVVGGAVVGVRRGLRQAPGADRAAAAALACLVLAYGVHMQVWSRTTHPKAHVGIHKLNNSTSCHGAQCRLKSGARTEIHRRLAVLADNFNIGGRRTDRG